MIKIKKTPSSDDSIGWLRISPYCNQQPGRPLSGQQRFDFVIIGAGFTGIATAKRLAELQPDATIAVVEALRVGEGASGRNSGYVVDLPLSADARSFNSVRDNKLFELNRFGTQLLRDGVDEHELQVDWKQSGKYASIHDLKHQNIIDNYVQVLDGLNEPYEVLNQAESAQRLGTDFYQRSIYTRGMSVVNPASLIIGLSQHLPDNVTLFEQSPVRRMELDAIKTLHFDRGRLDCEQVIFAGNAFNDAMSMTEQRVAPMLTYSSLTRPLNANELKAFSGVEEYAVRSAHPAGTSLRFTADKRFLVRNSIRATLTDTPASLQRAADIHRRSFENRFPELTQVPFEYSWSGNISITLNKQPHFSQVKPGCFAISGMNGSGIAKGTYLGHYMAEWISGRSSETLDFIQQNSNPNWIPPEPFRRLGASFFAALEERSAGLDI